MSFPGALARPFVLAAALAAALVGSAAAQEERFQDWELRCPEGGGEGCLVTHTVQLADQEVNILGIAVFYRRGEEEPTVAFRTPPETVASEELAIQIDEGEALTIPIARCGDQFCQTTANFPEAVAEQFRRGLQGMASFVLEPGQRVAVPFSLRGFTAAFEALKARTGRS